MVLRKGHHTHWLTFLAIWEASPSDTSWTRFMKRLRNDLLTMREMSLHTWHSCYWCVRHILWHIWVIHCYNIICIYHFSFSGLDKISCDNSFLRKIPAARLATTVLLMTFFVDTDHHAVLYHCVIDNERRTFLRGKWKCLGLSEFWRLTWFIFVWFCIYGSGEQEQWFFSSVEAYMYRKTRYCSDSSNIWARKS